jgi:uncharacterized SAM-binding protein YcdF (DUF218 family)
MILAALLLIVAVAALLIAAGRRRSSFILFTIAFITFVAAGCGFIPRLLLTHLQAGYGSGVTKWAAHNDIVLLGAGAQATDRGLELPVFSYGRLFRAFELYRECKARSLECHIISSGGDISGQGPSEAELYAAALLRLGAVLDDLINEDRSLNTWQNAQFTAAILQEHAGADVVLVTSGLHLKRSVQYFAHFGVRAVPVRGDYAMASVTWLPNSYNVLLTEFALHEYIGLLRYRVYNLLGWNVKAARPGSV